MHIGACRHRLQQERAHLQQEQCKQRLQLELKQQRAALLDAHQQARESEEVQHLKLLSHSNRALLANTVQQWASSLRPVQAVLKCLAYRHWHPVTIGSCLTPAVAD